MAKGNTKLAVLAILIVLALAIGAYYEVQDLGSGSSAHAPYAGVQTTAAPAGGGTTSTPATTAAATHWG